MPSRKRKCFAGTTYDFDAECCVGEGRFRVVVKVRHRVRRLRTTVKAAAIKSPHDATEEDEPADTRELVRDAQFLQACGKPTATRAS
jgi:hypothetical protein